MNRIAPFLLPSFAALILALVVTLASSCSQPQSSGALEVDQAHVDLGRLEFDARRELAFVIHNRGSSTITIERIELTCGCAKAVIIEKRLKPGAKTQLDVALRLDLPPGAFKKTILLHPDNGGEALVLSFSGHLEQSYQLLPSPLDFGDVPFGETVTRTVVIRPRLEAPMEIIDIPIGDERIRIRSLTSAPGEAKLEVSFRGDHRLGKFRHKALVHSAPQHGYGKIRIPLVGRVQGVLRPSLDQLVFDPSLQEQEFDFSWTLAHTKGEAFEVSSFSSGHRGLKVILADPIEGVIKIRVQGRVKPKELEGASLRIQSNLRDARELQLPWIAISKNG